MKRRNTRPGRNSKEQLWDKVLVPHQIIHTALSLSCFGGTESTSRWDKFMANDGMLPTNIDPRSVGAEGWWWWLLLTSPPTHQKNVHKLITPFLNNYYKNSHSLPQVGTRSLEGINSLWPPLPGKVIKIFFPIQKAYTSKIWLAMVYREAKLLASIGPS